jgi:hypothetical protein
VVLGKQQPFDSIHLSLTSHFSIFPQWPSATPLRPYRFCVLLRAAGRAALFDVFVRGRRGVVRERARVAAKSTFDNDNRNNNKQRPRTGCVSVCVYPGLKPLCAGRFFRYGHPGADSRPLPAAPEQEEQGLVAPFRR